MVSPPLQLDCSTADSTLESLAIILHLDRNVIQRRIRAFDVKTFLQQNPHYQIEPRDVVFEKIAGQNASPDPPQTISWFHATRVPPETTFEDGLQPLNLNLDRIWRFIHNLSVSSITQEKWFDFQSLTDDIGNPQYAMKTSDPMHWGPFAFLVRDVPLHAAEGNNHDYFDVPEIVEDICLSHPAPFGNELLDAFRSATCPCLVQFVSNIDRSDAIPAALFYLYCRSWDLGFPTAANTCFDAAGKTIPKSDIVNVEFFPLRKEG